MTGNGTDNFTAMNWSSAHMDESFAEDEEDEVDEDDEVQDVVDEEDEKEVEAAMSGGERRLLLV